MAKTEHRIAIDSTVIVNVLLGDGSSDDPAWLPAGTQLLAAVERGAFTAYISAVTIAEVFGTGAVRGSQLARDVRRQRVQAARRWLQAGYFTVVETDRSLAIEAADLAVEHQLKGPDAIILASAIRAKAEALYAWDEDLLKLNGIVSGLAIEKPSAVQLQLDLFVSLESG